MIAAVIRYVRLLFGADRPESAYAAQRRRKLDERIWAAWDGEAVAQERSRR